MRTCAPPGMPAGPPPATLPQQPPPPARPDLTGVRWGLAAAFGLAAAVVASSLAEAAVLSTPAVRALPLTTQYVVRSAVVVAFYLLLMLPVLVRARGQGVRFAEAVGLRSLAGGMPVALALVVALAGRAISGVWAIILYLLRVQLQGAAVDVTRFFGRSATGLLLTLFVAGVAAPLAEEIIFRGVVFSGLRSRFGDSAAMVGSAALFAAVHFNAAAAVPLFVFGLMLALTFLKTRTLWASVVCHATFNITGVLVVYGSLGASH